MLSSEDLPDPGIEPTSPALQVNSLLLSHQGSPSVTVGSYKIVFSYIENFYALCNFQICDSVLFNYSLNAILLYSNDIYFITASLCFLSSLSISFTPPSSTSGNH